MLDLAQIRERAAMGHGERVTGVTLAFLAQVADEIETGRRARAELERMRSREGKTFSRGSLG